VIPTRRARLGIRGRDWGVGRCRLHSHDWGRPRDMPTNTKARQAPPDEPQARCSGRQGQFTSLQLRGQARQTECVKNAALNGPKVSIGKSWRDPPPVDEHAIEPGVRNRGQRIAFRPSIDHPVEKPILSGRKPDVESLDVEWRDRAERNDDVEWLLRSRSWCDHDDRSSLYHFGWNEPSPKITDQDSALMWPECDWHCRA
jgi:hypothetical protein